MSDTFDPYYKWFDIPPDEQSVVLTGVGALDAEIEGRVVRDENVF